MTTPDLRKAFSVEVKTVTNNAFWQLSPHVKSANADSHVYVFVRIRQPKGKEEELFYFPVSSAFVAEHCRLPNPERPDDDQYRPGYSMDLKKVERFKANWSIFGVPPELPSVATFMSGTSPVGVPAAAA